LLDVDANPTAIFRGDSVVVIYIDPSIARKWLCKPLASLSLIDRTIRTVVLCDLVARWLVLVEVMLSVEPADGLYFTVESNGRAKGREEGGSLEFLYRMSPSLSHSPFHQDEPAGYLGRLGRTRQHWSWGSRWWRSELLDKKLARRD